MKQYYLHINNVQQGPYTLDEVKAGNINATTMVWYQGLTEWVPANQVEELSGLFATPPPLQFATVPPLMQTQDIAPPAYTTTYTDDDDEPVRIMGLKKMHFYIATAAVVLIVIFGLYMISANDQRIEQQQVIQDNQLQEKLDAQAAELEAQKQRIAEQERLEQQRRAEEAEQQRIQNLAAARENYDLSISNLQKAHNALARAKEFKLMRTGSERNADITAAQTAVHHWETEVEKYYLEIKNYGGN